MNEPLTYLKICGICTLLLSMLSGCSGSGIEAQHDFNPEVDLRGYRTYAFISENPMIVSQTQGALNPMLQGRLMESIRITMNGKGYNEVQ
ncbi:MAG: hypothetical protein ACC642_11660, partial [Pseudomonadales bacterium]